MSIICSQCDKELPDNARFCSFCGSEVKPEPVPALPELPVQNLCARCGKKAEYKVFMEESGETVELCAVCLNEYINNRKQSEPTPAELEIPKEPEKPAIHEEVNHHTCVWCGKEAEYKVYLEGIKKHAWTCDACYEDYINKPDGSSNSGLPWATIIEVTSVIFLIITTIIGLMVGSFLENSYFIDADGALFLGGLIGFAIGVLSVAQSMAIAETLRKVTSLTEKEDK